MFRFSVRPNRAHMIDWREWGEDAFEEARGQDKLVVLFIAAFWCGFSPYCKIRSKLPDKLIRAGKSSSPLLCPINQLDILASYVAVSENAFAARRLRKLCVTAPL